MEDLDMEFEYDAESQAEFYYDMFRENYGYLYELASQGDPESQYFFGLLGAVGEVGEARVPPEWCNFMNWFRLAAEQGYAKSQYELGERYLSGVDIELNLAEGIRWLRKSAEQEYDEAQFLLGECYDKGQGVPQDHNEAINWYTKAAEQGFAKAQCKLGDIYVHGIGVEVDYAEGIEWLQTAAEQRDAEAKYLMTKVRAFRKIIRKQ
jgi:TPR repeat protein